MLFTQRDVEEEEEEEVACLPDGYPKILKQWKVPDGCELTNRPPFLKRSSYFSKDVGVNCKSNRRPGFLSLLKRGPEIDLQGGISSWWTRSFLHKSGPTLKLAKSACLCVVVEELIIGFSQK